MLSPAPLRVALIGGGSGSFFAAPHQRAVHFDGTRRVVAAALRSNPAAALADAAGWPYPIRGYASYDELIDGQASCPPEERIDYAIVVTPNHAHFDPALKAVSAGIPVFCEKPLTLTSQEAERLVVAVESAGVPFGVAHTYLGHWTARFARHIVRSGLLGEVRWVDSYYIQGWLAGKVEESGMQQAAWRTDPARTGMSNCGGDIGTHALMMLRYVTGLEIESLSAQLETLVPGRVLDDHFTVYTRLHGGARALIRASQICIGARNNHGLVVAGARGLLRWEQEEPERLTVCLPDRPERVYWRGAVTPHDGFLGDVPPELLSEPTLPPGHNEGFHDALARLHRCFEEDVRSWKHGAHSSADASRYATIHDGLVGMRFIEAAVESSKDNGAWKSLL